MQIAFMKYRLEMAITGVDLSKLLGANLIYWEGQNVVITDESMGVSQILRGCRSRYGLYCNFCTLESMATAVTMDSRGRHTRVGRTLEYATPGLQSTFCLSRGGLQSRSYLEYVVTATGAQAGRLPKSTPMIAMVEDASMTRKELMRGTEKKPTVKNPINQSVIICDSENWTLEGQRCLRGGYINYIWCRMEKLTEHWTSRKANKETRQKLA